MILLDARALVVDVQRWRDPLGEDAGAEAARSGTDDPAVEDQLDLVGAAEVEVLANDLLEEQAAVHGLVEHLGERELGLQDGDVVAIAGTPVGGGEGMRQTAQPLAQQSVDPGRRQAVADRLQALRIGTGLDAVVERLESNALLGELLLGVLVTVQAELGVGKNLTLETPRT